MLFPDITCTLTDSLKKNMKYGIYDLVEADFIEIVTVYKATGALQINREIEKKTVDHSVVDCFLSTHISDFLAGIVFRNVEYEGHFFHMTSNKEAKPFFAFTLLCRKGVPFLMENLKWIDIYTDLHNEGIILENTLKQERNFLDSVITCSSSSIIALDRKCKVLSANPAAIKMFNLEGNNHICFPDEEEERAFRDAVALVMGGGTLQRFKTRILPHRHGDKVINAVLSPLRDSKNRIAGVVVVAVDITEIQLLSLEVELLKQYGLLGELSMGLAHDIKNPLMSIQGCAQLLQNPKDPQRKAELINIILHEVTRVNAVVNQMLTFGDTVNNRENSFVDIKDVLLKCTQIIDRQKMKRTIHFTFNFTDELPKFYVNELHFRQIFLNLMLNSLQAITQEGEIRISTRYCSDEKSVCIEIEDTGTGISEENLSKIFTPYFTTKKNGTGMGLLIVKRSLEKYNGKISIQSKLGQGTRCLITLPEVREKDEL
ncbi:nitrogen regulation protein NR(II) [Desulfitobacterium sp. Sab5]|uniref:two-component system sensor histidine kinase NtrB n=1 Tax=Desulfitobacterium nosdiversum TaxID=3375356 RepID=UPI003CF65F7F